MGTSEEPRSQVEYLRNLRSEKESDIEATRVQAEARVQLLGTEIGLIDQTIGNYIQLFPGLAQPALQAPAAALNAAKPEKLEDWIILVLSLRSGEWLSTTELTQECLDAGWTTSSAEPKAVVIQMIVQMRAKGVIGSGKRAKIIERATETRAKQYSYKA